MRRRSIALFCLLLAAMVPLGSGLQHEGSHEIDHGELPRFESGHAKPISQRHIESARTVAVDDCLACIVRQHSLDRVVRLATVAQAPPPAGLIPVCTSEVPCGDVLSRPPGRAPPLA